MYALELDGDDREFGDLPWVAETPLIAPFPPTFR